MTEERLRRLSKDAVCSWKQKPDMLAEAAEIIFAQEKEIKRLKRYKWAKETRMKADARWAKAEAKLAKVYEWAESEVDDRVHDYAVAQRYVLAILDEEER